MDLDPVIHAPVRLQIVSLLAAGEEVEFGFVRDTLGVSDSVLSKHGSALEAAGYVHVRKGHIGKRPRTWYRLTDVGRAAFRTYVSNLQKIVSPSGLAILPPADTPGTS
ncbi:winged helix-turn-helix domain-containing protein [Sphaerimonospora thailandensis]|uniref:MarR family transcriptional regulator n=1 Tax=Sphaerimonospora thailandensis TaxID=795644 RepID=A0A8J3VYX9_9ACTN|nr:transcriptional regulator [Sphaerimonospora thailandensis]GIH69331.1 MarR family transcriptional regulator [Sphaerimonospora thailandensis]